jgi:hypothetical protein
MKRTPHSELPRLRADDLVIHELPDEVLIYDRVTDQAHCLNHTAALVWRACNGRRTPTEIARKLTTQVDAAVSEDLVVLALVSLQKLNLLERTSSSPFSRLSRRQIIRTLGTVAIALPVITTIMVPSPAQAATCLPPGQPCSPVMLCCTSCNPAAPGGPKCF